MSFVAIAVFVVMIVVTLWAWRVAPAKQAADQFVGIWRGTPWGKQLILDFFGLEIVLALWMLRDAAEHGSWLLSVACIAAMPIFGSMSAAVYWLARGVGAAG